MPHTINGVGTWYYGKQRLLKVHGTCSQCGASGQLLSYDTTHYFVLFFVPIIPLGKFRIIEECPACQRHRWVKLKQWEELKAQSLAEVRQQMKTDGDKRKAAIQALQIAVGYQDESMLRSVANGLAAGMTEDEEVQSLLGAAYAYFGHDEEAVEPLQQALDLKDDPENRQMLAATLVRLRRPDEAEEVLATDLKAPKAEHIGTLVMLAEGHQSIGQHARAVQLLERCTEIVPAIASDKEYKKLLAKARKYQGSSKPLVSKALSSASGERYQEGGRGASIARWLFPIILVVAAIGYFATAWKIGAGRKVYVVNGLSIPYTAVIAGESVPLGPQSRTEITIPEGDVPIAIEGRTDFPAESVELSTSFFTRPFNGDVYVINPDRTAILLWEQQWYGENLGDDVENDWVPSAGKLLHRFDDVDLEFMPFPEQLKVSNKSKSVSRTRVDFLRRNDPEWPATRLLMMLTSSLTQADLTEFSKYWATGEPENEAAVGLWGQSAAYEEWLAWARPRLDQRPVLLNVHRGYQTRAEKSEPERDLLPEYQQRLAAHPDDPALKYLVARITDDPHESRRLLQEAAQGPEPLPTILNALAFDHLMVGEFVEAHRYAQQSYQRSPDSLGVQQIYQQTAMATQDVAELLADVTRRRFSAPHDMALIQEQLSLLIAMEDFAGADAFIPMAMAPFRQDAPEAAPLLEAMYRALLEYAQGDIAGFAEQLAMADTEAAKSFPLAVTQKNPQAAAAALDETPPETSDESAAARRLLVYLLYADQGDAAAAQTQLKLAIDALQQGDKSSRFAAQALQSEMLSADDVERLLWLSMHAEDKRTLLTALGTRHPQHKDQFFSLARKLNYERTFPYLTLQQLLQ